MYAEYDDVNQVPCNFDDAKIKIQWDDLDIVNKFIICLPMIFTILFIIYSLWKGHTLYRKWQAPIEQSQA